MRRREFLMAMAAAAVTAYITKADGTEDTAIAAKKYLRMIMLNRKKADKLVIGRQDLNKIRGHSGQTFDAELGWIFTKSISPDGVDGSKGFYNYEPDGARKVVNFPDKTSRIHTYGDSFTHCGQVSDGETWQEYLAAHLQEPIRNYGIGGFGVYQAYLRMLKVEKQNAAKYIILNIFSDDHFRNLDAWQTIRKGGIGTFTSPYLKVNIRQGRCEEFKNVISTPQQVYQLCDEDFLWQTFRDDPILKTVLAVGPAALRQYGVPYPPPDYSRHPRKISAKTVESIAKTFGIPTEKITGANFTEQIRNIHIEAALYATKNVITWMERFIESTGRKMMIILSFGLNNLAAELKGQPRFDRSFVDWLKDKPYPVIDMLDAFRADYQQFNEDINAYMSRYYIGHHNPAGNFFTSWAIKNSVVEWLDPPPLPYR